MFDWHLDFVRAGLPRLRLAIDPPALRGAIGVTVLDVVELGTVGKVFRLF